MARTALSNTGDWALEFPDDQDVRGYRVVDNDGDDTGLTVEEMVVDTDQEMVDAIILSDGTEYPARDISIGDGVVYTTAEAVEGTRRAGDIDRFGATVPNSGVRVYDDDVAGEYDSDYRTHYEGTYASTDRDYDEDLSHAYRYGTESAHGDDFRNRGYLDAEDDLRTGYSSRHTDRDFDSDRDAIRYGYNRARGSY